MSERRDCCEVIYNMLAHIPASQWELIKDLQWNYEDALYKAPEETLQWERTAMTLQTHIPKPVHDWQFDVVSIFTTMPVEELKRKYPSCE